MLSFEQQLERVASLPSQKLELMEQLFTLVPSEIITDILSRLPVRTIIHCKSVCKSWLDLISTHDFVKSHLSKSAPALTVYHTDPDLEIEMYKLFEFQDGPHHYNPLTNFTLPYYGWMCGSVNGFLFMSDLNTKPHSLYLCNPITREYTNLDSPNEFFYSPKQIVTYGFGVSRTTGQHKVVGFTHGTPTDEETSFQSECRVYALETGSWRRIDPPLMYGNEMPGSFLNGNLHWLVFGPGSTPFISCFDLEAEIFSTLSCDLPLLGSKGFLASLVVLEDCLCLCDNTSADNIVIWLMKEYGMEKSWTKEFVISKNIPAFNDCVKIGAIYPIKVFKDGDILMAWDDDFLFYHSKKNNMTEIIDMFDPRGCIDTFLHTPSFLSLKNFTNGDVICF